MEYDPGIGKQIGAAYSNSSQEPTKFLELLKRHPEFLRNADGTDEWMWQAAMNGNLPLLQGLVALGLDVNESMDRDDPADPNPFYQAEGPILQAAGHGHLEMVRWLLERGARINYEVHGRRRCLPLVDAAIHGHLQVVKLLVEHGADIHHMFNGYNPITWAEDNGQCHVRDYLRSLGARTLRETTPPDYPAAHDRFLQTMTHRHGRPGRWRLTIAGDPTVSVRCIPANRKSKELEVFTVGLSDHRLATPDFPHACTELHLRFPPDWPLGSKAAERKWPVDWLVRIVGELRRATRWPDPPVVFADEPPAPLGPGTALCAWVCLEWRAATVEAPDYRFIRVHSLVPVYAEELELVRRAGTDELVRRLEARELPTWVDPRRPNVAEAPPDAS